MTGHSQRRQARTITMLSRHISKQTKLHLSQSITLDMTTHSYPMQNWMHARATAQKRSVAPFQQVYERPPFLARQGREVWHRQRPDGPSTRCHHIHGTQDLFMAHLIEHIRHSQAVRKQVRKTRAHGKRHGRHEQQALLCLGLQRERQS